MKNNLKTKFESRYLDAYKHFRALQKIALFCCIFLPSTFNLQAQNYSIDWYKIAGGGGTSSNGQYSVVGTIGQHDASGAMSGGNYSLTGGFWSLIAVVQTSGTPTLTITHSGSNVIVSWPSPATGFVLQQSGNLANPNGWANFGGIVGDNGTIKSVTNSPPAGNLFFRLKQ
ncbi:MAG TPA: hypothetical protein VIK59_06375 [Verrucomicrobiae bacterium]